MHEINGSEFDAQRRLNGMGVDMVDNTSSCVETLQRLLAIAARRTLELEGGVAGEESKAWSVEQQ